MRLTPTRVATTVAASAALMVTGLASGASADTTILAPHDTFTLALNPATGVVTPPASGEDIPNIDSVKSTIRQYYNVFTSGADKGKANPTSSRYLDQVAAIESTLASLPALTGSDIGAKAVVFDIDDTLLWNYDFEDQATSFNFDGALNAQWVHDQRFPAVPGMPGLVSTLEGKGYAIYAVTGRPSYQEPDTVANLAAQGFTADDGNGRQVPVFTAANTFTKWGTNAAAGQPDTYDPAEVPDYIKSGECSTHVGTDPSTYKCTTVEYKAQTRKHIQDADGVDIVANVGDQLSDLWGGYADQAYKIPNPTYFLASPDLANPPADDQAASLQPDATYTMLPNGDSGRTVASGDDIPNIDPVRSDIRNYYAATNGIANKTASSYISNLASLESTWTRQITTDCQKGQAAIDDAKAAITRAQAAVAAADRAIVAADAALVRADKALRKARRHHHPRLARKARLARQAALRAREQAVAARAAARHVLATTRVPGRPAAVFDADDTTLWTYDMEDGAMKFVFNPTVQNDEWVQPQRFPAVPGMPELVANVADAGCTIFGLTGRTDSQKYATLGNLAKVGYSDFRANNYYTKWNSGAPVPSYLHCADPAKCTTIEYKSGTRAYIEEHRGFHIVANLGDQFSDLIGGHAERTYKLPNPTYYLP